MPFTREVAVCLFEEVGATDCVIDVDEHEDDDGERVEDVETDDVLLTIILAEEETVVEPDGETEGDLLIEGEFDEDAVDRTDGLDAVVAELVTLTVVDGVDEGLCD